MLRRFKVEKSSVPFLLPVSKNKKQLLPIGLGIGLFFSAPSYSYDENTFPGLGSKNDFAKSCKICSKGSHLLDSGKPEEAIPYFKRAIAVYPHAASFYFNMGSAYHDLNDYKNALSAYRVAIKLAPDMGRAYNNMSDIQFKLKDFRAAEQSAKMSSTLDRNSSSALINLAQAEIALNKANLAKQHLQLAKSLPDAKLYTADFRFVDDLLKKSFSKSAAN